MQCRYAPLFSSFSRECHHCRQPLTWRPFLPLACNCQRLTGWEIEGEGGKTKKKHKSQVPCRNQTHNLFITRHELRHCATTTAPSLNPQKSNFRSVSSKQKSAKITFARFATHPYQIRSSDAGLVRKHPHPHLSNPLKQDGNKGCWMPPPPQLGHLVSRPDRCCRFHAWLTTLMSLANLISLL